MQPATAITPLSGGTGTGQFASASPIGTDLGFRLALQAVQTTADHSSTASSSMSEESVPPMPAPPLTIPAQQVGGEPASVIVPVGRVATGATASHVRMSLPAIAMEEFAKPASGGIAPVNESTPAIPSREATSDAPDGSSASILAVPEISPTVTIHGGTSIGPPPSEMETELPGATTILPQFSLGSGSASGEPVTEQAVTPKPAGPAVASAKSSPLHRTFQTADSVPEAALVAMPVALLPPTAVSAAPTQPASSGAEPAPQAFGHPNLTISGRNMSSILEKSAAKNSDPASTDINAAARYNGPVSATAQPAVSGQGSIGRTATQLPSPELNAAANTSARSPPLVENPTSSVAVSPDAQPLRSGDVLAAAAQPGGAAAITERKPVLQTVSELTASIPATTIDGTLLNLAAPAPAPSTEPHAATTAVPASPVSASSPTASPAHQIVPALLAVRLDQDSVQRMTLRLNPAELGMVQVQIERAAAGPAHVVITAERAETLQMLQQDQPQLHRALDQAGISAQGRTVTFHVAPTSQPSSSHLSGGNSSSSGGQGGFTGGGGGGGSAGYAARDQTNHPGTRRANNLPPRMGKQDETTTAKWLRVGLDITA